MPNSKGQFIKGEHWRPRKPHWDKAWLKIEYVDKKRTASEIAAEIGITDNAILFWLSKHKISTRSISETRAIKKWGSIGEKNQMFGKVGILNPNWKGGLTPARQLVYASRDCP